MAYNSIEKFLENPWEYNFEFECGDEEYANLDALERYFIYKITPGNTVYDGVNSFIDKHSQLLNIYDADGSGKCFYPLIHSIYEKLWGWERNEVTFGTIGSWESEVLWGSDTMNSVQTVLNSLAKQLADDINDLPTKKGHFSFNYIMECWLLNNEFKDRLNQQQKFKDYINAYHTLGNFVIVPAGFNGFRGTNKSLCDYWDLSLDYLQKNEYGDFNPDSHFTKYINFFFLWDYVSKGDGEYTVRDISPRDMKNKDEFVGFFNKAIGFINRRGIFMTAMLKLAADEKYRETYQKLQADIFSKNDICYEGLNDVIERIKAHAIVKSANGLPSGVSDLLDMLT
ncbi:MAG: hypothetical protein HDT43_06375 [Ruminococcaceae bacterium]|nr:hypothetical protein [Oscillospiraceae bacterium]